MKPLITVLFGLALCTIVASSATEQPTPKKIFEAYCVKCHAGIAAPKGVDLTSLPGVRAALVPGDAEKSRIFKAVLGIGGVDQMPPYRYLTMEQVQALRRWINSGADEKGYTEPFVMNSMGGVEPVDPCLAK